MYSEPAQEWRIAQYKSDQHQQQQHKYNIVYMMYHFNFYVWLHDLQAMQCSDSIQSFTGRRLKDD